MNIVGIIPARMASSRFPGKPMADIHGMPMIGHCYLRSRMSKTLSDCWVATPDLEIFEYIESIGGKPLITSHNHEMCNDRVVEAVKKIKKSSGKKIDIVVNIQGDLPMVFPDMIDDTVKPLTDDSRIKCSTMMDKIESIEDFLDPNRVKVVIDLNQNAILLTREPVPSGHKFKEYYPKYKHVAIRAYATDLFSGLARMDMSPIEKIEGIDDLRLIENDIKIKVVLTERVTETVDTPQDLEKVIEMMQNDELMKDYI
jgi:3-deoxy-manno-octulosonate cytidylyltransferase (CMP-KDO synthetase)|tara:strand:+ start:2654 stop:3421 length:768 start_codon:yes stop_codon:yes gene_type:complete